MIWFWCWSTFAQHFKFELRHVDFWRGINLLITAPCPERSAVYQVAARKLLIKSRQADRFGIRGQGTAKYRDGQMLNVSLPQYFAWPANATLRGWNNLQQGCIFSWNLQTNGKKCSKQNLQTNVKQPTTDNFLPFCFSFWEVIPLFIAWILYIKSRFIF